MQPTGHVFRAEKITPYIVLAILSLLTACQQVMTKTADYQPEKAGTVDHALCLLGFTAVPLRELITGHHLVDTKLNGRDATFVVDTGANATVLNTAYAGDFGLSGRATPGGAIGLGGSLKASQSRIDSLTIGGVPIRQSRIMVSDLSQIARLLEPLSGGRTIHGIIGQDVMKEHRAVIDVAAPILYLIAADEDPAPVAAAQCTAAPGEGKGGKGPA